MLESRQLSLVGGDQLVAEACPDPGLDYGEVFTRRWVVDLILDLVGYTSDVDLGARVIVEPSCGTGAFLIPVVERLIESSRAHGRDLQSLAQAVQAFDLLDANAQRSRKAVVALLELHGLGVDVAESLAAGWIRTGDFLLHQHELGEADYVVGNPPYIRLENIPRNAMDQYRRLCPTMRGRADVYVGFIERGLELLARGGALGFICADRWMRNQYGADLRHFITTRFSVDAIIQMHDVDAFEDDVDAYPAILAARHAEQGETVVVDTNASFDADSVPRLTSWARRSGAGADVTVAYEATRVDGWFSGPDLWPAGSPRQLAVIADIERRFPPLENPDTGTRVGIGVATGCDQVFITDEPDLVESSRLLPLVQSIDIAAGSVVWPQRYLVNPWDESGLVNLSDYPRLASYLERHQYRLRGRHIAQRRPATWYRTIDRVSADIQLRPKLLIPDIKAYAHPVLDTGGFYPHHNLYYVVSDEWDLEVLGGLLLSDVTNLFVGAYCVKMRGGTYRFQAQYLRRIRVPEPSSIRSADRDALVEAFRTRDVEFATAVAERLYGIAGAMS